ncbi:MAG: UvrD-helicase domain-containing protein [Oscillospiraceae bacterium]|nr:UvrD-helicase domain-containing protein [Oscillospiraceae bacterium]
MGEKLTVQQQQAVEYRGGKLLVSAAAGSGKTKVLVDRLLSYLTDPVKPADLDAFLLITYTKAAAAELRGKIAKRLTETVAQQPENRHLQRQIQRLYLTKISTVHSFCTDILREYAYRLDISSDFRVADEDECFEIMNRVIEQVLDKAYENADTDPDFRAFVDTQGFGRDDRQIPELIMMVYKSARCHLDPDKWLSWCTSIGDVDADADASQTPWGEYLLEDLRNYLQKQITTLQNAQAALVTNGKCDKVVDLLGHTISQLSVLLIARTWDAVYENRNIDYGRLTFPTKFEDVDLKEKVKAVRDSCKKGVTNKLRRFSMNSKQLIADIRQSQCAIRGLVALVKAFDTAYSKAKQSRRVLDFGDLEHKTLDLLTGKSRCDITKIAEEIGNRFREVMVDEYQDSNAVQDAIFNAITHKKQNCFMVGDVKQSIYQFRLADPGIFLHKYENYATYAGEADVGGNKVILSHNFRSAPNVIRAVNDVFTTCMHKEVGGLKYGPEEQLNEGIPHEIVQEREVELFAVEGNDDVYAYEADFVAGKIISLLDGTHMIRSDKSLRPIRPEDIVILLRSPGSVGGVYEYALASRGIRCVSGGTVDMLQTEEIEVLRSFLQVIHNPLQDIPLLSVLTCRVIGFTADDIAHIRSRNKNVSIYEALIEADDNKTRDFLMLLQELRREAQMNNLAQLLMFLLARTHMDSIYSALTDGAERCENIQNFCRLAGSYETSVGGGLNRFLEHLAILERRGIDPAVEPNTDGAVRIMSIHKSKGLEFPVVFLCGLSRSFNMESSRAKVLCDKELGLGLSCVDNQLAVRYPTLAKQAVAQKIIAESVSEEMRVLYVAMTRAKDRLIMTYTEKNIDDKLEKKKNVIDFSLPELSTEDADCAGDWILQTALTLHNDFWHIYRQSAQAGMMLADSPQLQSGIAPERLAELKAALSHQYPYIPATQTPSKQTATQIKGRQKDLEAAEQTVHKDERFAPDWRRPNFMGGGKSAVAYGNTVHTFLRYIRFSQCGDVSGIDAEIRRLVAENCLSEEEARVINSRQIADFFQSDIGTALRNHPNVIREFKFSILDDAQKYNAEVLAEKVLLQGVVDCAMISEDGITVLDFKTDRVTKDTINEAAEQYRTQIETYADALSRIYDLPVKSALLYFFHCGTAVPVI